MKKFGKKIAGFLLAAVLAVTAAFPAFAASKTAVGKIYLTIDSTVGLKNDSEDVTVTPYGDNTDLYYVDNIISKITTETAIRSPIHRRSR